MLIKDLSVAGLREAKEVQDEIQRLGIPDVKLFFDGELRIWGVFQVRQQNIKIFMMDSQDTKIEKYLMWWCTDEGKYRVPGKKDVNDVVATVRRAQHWFKKGGDKLADELDEQETKKRLAKENNLKERLAPHVKALNKAVREEMG